ncbi:unnamed protein product [Ilex paraguariensis]|uniref:Serine-rich protein-like protein n=1 Tax=Ilex paraguariensis TaxID=185542 RepID=A0ABC8QNN9_9AQUA
MAATASTRRSSGPVVRSLSPSGRFYSPRANTSFSSSAAFASSSSSFSSRSTTFFNRSTSPTRVNMYGLASSAPSVHLSLDRPISPNRSISVSARNQGVKKQTNNQTASCRKRTCMCSPTTHPGSFRCSFHKNLANSQTVSYSSNRLNARRSAMTNSLVRIGTVEGDLVKRALSALIRPSSHQQKRRAAFQPRPSRLSVMSKGDLL